MRQLVQVCIEIYRSHDTSTLMPHVNTESLQSMNKIQNMINVDTCLVGMYKDSHIAKYLGKYQSTGSLY